AFETGQSVLQRDLVIDGQRRFERVGGFLDARLAEQGRRNGSGVTAAVRYVHTDADAERARAVGGAVGVASLAVNADDLLGIDERRSRRVLREADCNAADIARTTGGK